MKTDSRIAGIAVALTLCALTKPALSQPALIGEWRATLDVGGKSLRLALHIAPAASGYSAKLDSLDQAAFDMPVDTIRIDAAHLHFEMNQLRASFDGSWDATAMQFEGQWQQGPNALPAAWKRAPAASPDRPLSQEDREFLMAYLEKTQDDLLRSIGKLTPAQWTYQPDPTRWSIAQCVEHLILEEETLFQGVTRQIVRIPLPEGLSRADRKHDERVIQYMTDRTRKVNAAESMQPSGKLATMQEGMAQFSKARAGTIEWVRATQADLRGHGTRDSTFESLDTYGYLLVMAAHSARHTAQIEEVKTTKGYPQLFAF